MRHTVETLSDTEPNKIIYNNSVYDNTPDTAFFGVLILRNSNFMGCVKGLGATLLKRLLFAKDFLNLISVEINIDTLSPEDFERILFENLPQTGGNKNYINKYLKYKQKYLKLKKLIN